MKNCKMMLLLGALVLAAGCSDDSPGDPAGGQCPGELIEVEGSPYCVFIEEGFLVEDCPEDFPEGQEIEGVVVCSEDGDIPENEVKAELEERGLLDDENDDNNDNNDMACVEDSDCPPPDNAPSCDGDTAIIPPPGSAECLEGVCSVIAAPGLPMTIDCAADGLTCRDGECVEAGDECVEDEDCPQPIPFFDCEGQVAVRIVASGGCEAGVCMITGGETRTDCSEEGAVCQFGDCVALGACETVDDCPQPDNEPFCEGDVAVEPAPASAECMEGMCTLIGAPVEPIRTDCAAQELECAQGICQE